MKGLWASMSGVVLGLGGALLSQGCGIDFDNCRNIQCGPCPPALTVRVSAEGGGLVEDAALVGEPGACSVTGSETICTPSRSEPGEYAFDVTAPGFRTQRVTATVAAAEEVGCCSCGYASQTVEIALQAE